MRDPERIEFVLSLLDHIWRRNPDLRLAQVLCSVLRSGEGLSTLYYLEDEELEQRLRDGYLSE